MSGANPTGGNPTGANPTGEWPPILVLGRDTCEDTTRSRAFLDGHVIPYDYRRVDREPEADEWIRRLNGDVWVTPTILIGDPQAPDQILREPSDDELDAAIAQNAAR